MMAFFLYIIQSGFCLILFYFFFKWAMSRTTFFRMNRVLILIGLCLCTILPFIEITIGSEPFQSPFHAFREALLTMDTPFSEHEALLSSASGANLLENNELLSKTSPSYLSYFFMGFFIVYSLGVLITSVYVITSFCRMSRLIRSSKKEKIDNYTLVLVSDSICPFSWGRYLVLSESDYHHYPEVLMHERLHQQLFHTADLLFMQLFLILHWFNPAIWLLKRELQEIHEYEADNGVINTGIDATKYQLLLVEKTVGTRLYSMANSFNHSKLKNRITMMLKEKTNRYARLRLLFLAPAMVGVILVFARPEIGQVKELLTAEVLQPLSEEGTPDLKKEFNEKLSAYELQVYGKVLDENERDYKGHSLLINAKGVIMLNQQYPIADVKQELTRQIKNTWNKPGKKEPQIITMIWDRATDSKRIEEVLQAVKEIETELERSNSGDVNMPNLTKSFPLLVYICTLKSF